MDCGSYYDFHIHTSCSDGKLSPGDVVRLAIANNLNTIAITDHYTLAAVDYAKAVLKKMEEDGELEGRKLTIIPGIEISANSESKNKRIHIVGLYVNKSIYNLVDQYEKNRKVLTEEVIRRLRDRMGYRITMKDVERFARDKSSIGRFDIALALYGMQYATSVNKAYEDILMSTAIFVEREKFSPEEVIKAIIASKGVPILAHPNSCKLMSCAFEDMIEEFKSYGLAGIEAYTGHIVGEKREKVLDICERLDLIPVAGSDFHSLARKSPTIGLGIDNNICYNSPQMLREIKKARKRILSMDK